MVAHCTAEMGDIIISQFSVNIMKVQKHDCQKKEKGQNQKPK